MTWNLILSVLPALVALPLALYCYVLSRRLRRLNDLETGLGGAIAVMTAEISRLDKAIRRAKTEAEDATTKLAASISQARDEKAYWQLQKELSRSGGTVSRRLKPRQSGRAGIDA